MLSSQTTHFGKGQRGLQHSANVVKQIAADESPWRARYMDGFGSTYTKTCKTLEMLQHHADTGMAKTCDQQHGSNDSSACENPGKACGA